jgi:membrane protease YdiL (CAAX protease family)
VPERLELAMRVRNSLGRGRPWQLRGHSWQVLFLYAAVAAVGGLVGLWYGRSNVWFHPAAEPAGWAVRAGGIVAGLTIGLGMVLLSRVTVARYPWARWLETEFRHRVGPLSQRDCLVLAGASSVGEEILFRGALVPALGVGWSSLIFALFHIGPRARYLPWTVSAFLAALALGALYQGTGELTGPVLAHFTLNYINLRHLARRTNRW